MRVALRRAAAPAALTAALLLSGCGGGAAPSTDANPKHADPTGAASPSPSASGPAPGLGRMIGHAHGKDADFTDPYPVYRSSGGTSAPDPHLVFGTTKALLSCPGAIKPGCYRRTPITLRIDPALDRRAAAAGNEITTNQNHNPYVDAAGHWHMALTVKVRPRSATGHGWSVVLHARPDGGGSPAPAHWTADRVLAGSLTHRQKADYDGKYFQDRGTLYLLYSRRLNNKPARDGIVAQRMTDPGHPDTAAQPVVLLRPEPDPGYRSELFFEDRPKSRFKLVETGNITKIGGSYVMAYSTGAFDEDDYKTGLARSSTFLPHGTSGYPKDAVPDPHGVWHNPGGKDVDYLLQSQAKNWPGYSAAQVLAPGVPAVVRDGSRGYRLLLAGYLPGDTAARKGPHHFDPARRQPLVAPLCASGTTIRLGCAG